MPTTPPIALTIAGSDSGGGAGIQADLKTFSALGVYGASVITAVTAQNTQTVSAIHTLPGDMISAQIAAVLDDLNVSAIKIGMLSSVSVIEAVADALKDYTGTIVLDPVMVAKSGDLLLRTDAIDCLRQHLLPRATLLTPNLPEAAVLLGLPAASDEATMRVQAGALLALNPRAVLMKGGHADGETCVDLLMDANGCSRYQAPRLATKNTHGTGCTLSSAIAAQLAKGLPLPQAVEHAHQYLHAAIMAADSLSIGSGHGPVHHFHALWEKG